MIQSKSQVILLVLLFAGLSHAVPISTAFTYQGELKRQGTSANGEFAFRFELFDISTGGSSIVAPEFLDNVEVVGGVFTVELDFGQAPFSGEQLWLEIGVRDGASTGGYTGLLPRQRVTAVPYAIRAETVTTDAVNDADADPTNEIQDLLLNGDTLNLTGDATPVDLSMYRDNTDDQTLAEVLVLGNDAEAQSIGNIGDLGVGGTTTSAGLTLTGFDCTANGNGGALTANAAGVVSCSDDEDSANSLDAAYDQGGSGAGRSITADAGPVIIQGTGGLDLDGGSLRQLPADPALLGSLGVGTNPNGIVVSGRYAYVIDPSADDLKVIDVTDPQTPTLVGSLGMAGNPQAVALSGRYAYLVDFFDFTVIDVSDSSAPTPVGNLGIGQTPSSVSVSGRYAYVVDFGSDDLKVIDVSDPGAPSLAGSLSIGPFPRSVAVARGYAYVVDSVSDDLKVIDLSVPSTPSLVGSLSIGGNPQHVVVSGRYAYVVDFDSEDLKVIDVSDPDAPNLTGSLFIGTAPSSVVVSGRYAYVVDQGSDDLKVIDVSDPGAPTLAGSLRIGTQPISLDVSGRYAYVVDIGSDDFKVIDVSGGEFSSLIAHSLEAGNLQVRNDLTAQGQLRVSGGVTVGAGGMFSDGDIGISGTIALANDVAPTSSPTNLVQLFAQDAAGSSELMVRDEAGNITTLSPHNFSLIGRPSEPMAWSYHSENDRGRINVDMLRTVRLVEALTGAKLVHIESAEKDIDFRDPSIVGRHKPVAPLIQAVKELKAQSAQKDSQIRELQARLAALERRIN